MAKKLLQICLLCFFSIMPTQAQQISGDVPYVIFVGHARDYNNSWVVFRNGLVAGMNRLNLNIELRNAPSGNLDDIENLVQSAIAAQPDGLILSAPREELARKWVTAAQEKNIPVILVGSSGINHYVNKGKFPLISIGQDHYQGGYLLGKKLKKNGITNTVCIVPRLDVDEHLERCRGASDALKQNINVFSLDVIDANLTEFFKDYLASHPDLQNVILTEVTALKRIHALLGNLSAAKDISIVSFGLTRQTANLIRAKNKVLFSVDSQPFLQGYTAAMIYNSYFKHGIIWGSRHVITGPEIIDSSNVRAIASFAGTIR